MSEIPKKFYWEANTSSGGSVSLMLRLEGNFSKEEKLTALAGSLHQSIKFMEKKGYLPRNTAFLSSRDIAAEYGNTRQYWEKLFNEGKIKYQETSAGRITTTLWVNGFLDNRENVNKYVRAVKKALKRINNTDMASGTIFCPLCEKKCFRFAKNTGNNTNGVCYSCNFCLYT